MLQRVLDRVKRFLCPENRRSQLLRMVLVALAIRLAVMVFVYTDQLNPANDHHAFGCEVGRIARSLVQGHGFGNPLFGATGPTAILAPVYPYLLAGVFKIFGIYTAASALVMLSFQSLISSLTCLPVFFIARRGFGDRVALWAGWTWAFFPYSIYFPLEAIWPIWLTTLLLSLLFLITLELQKSSRIAGWIGFGLLWGFSALNEPMVLMVLPCLAGWACYRLDQRGQRWFGRAAVAALVFVAVVSPWFVRNYQTFHRLLPFKDNFGLELRLGNNGNTASWASWEAGPWKSDAEWQEYQRQGELAYIDYKAQQAREFIRSHPGQYAWMTVRRVAYIWTGFWSLSHDYLDDEPLEIPYVLTCTAFTMLAFVGLWRAFKRDVAVAAPCGLVLIFYPLMYYVTHGAVYFRRPLEPLLVVLAVYAVVSRKGRDEQASGNAECRSEAPVMIGAAEE